jgi:hypothetical protein
MPTIVIFRTFVVRGARLPRLAPRRSVGASRGVCRGRVQAGLTADNLAEVPIIQEALREARRPTVFGGTCGRRDARLRTSDDTGSTPGP